MKSKKPMSPSKRDLIAILRSIVCCDGTPIPSDANWPALWSLAQRNHLEAIIYKAMPVDIAAPLEDDYYYYVIRSGQQELLLEQIEQALTKADIHYALQKGSLLRGDYPKVQLRFLTDMDFYIRSEDRGAIRAAMLSIGGAPKGGDSGDEQFLFEGGLGVEFHGRLLYRKTKRGIENYPDWQFVNEQTNRLTEEGFVLNLIGHAVGDLAKGGPGIRYILDLWVYRHRHMPQPDWDAVWDRLKADGIDAAAKNLLDLSEYLFGDGEETDLLKEMAEYVLEGGLYGDSKRGAAAETARSGSKCRAMIRQVLRNRTEYENRYPWLKRYPFLLPVAWVMRVWRSFHSNGKAIKEWRNGMRSVQKDEVKKQKERLTRFGL